MRYGQIEKASFIARPNRFIAQVFMDGETVTAHVKNTGRCRELLTPGAQVWLEHSDAPGRKTQWSLVAVQKGSLLINMDSQAPNKAAGEWLRSPAMALPGFQGPARTVRPEYKWGDSRFDFYLENDSQKALVEVKGVTLELEGKTFFPDAPTQRGVKHLEELGRAAKEGYLCYALFVIQMEGIGSFSPNRLTHPEFGRAMEQARDSGVSLLAYSCKVTPQSMELDRPVPVIL